MTTPAKYFMLMGWARFLGSSANDDLMKQIVKRRTGGNWGIATKEADDYWALQWRRYNFRRQRAQRAIGQDKLRTMSFTGDGPLTVRLIGVDIAGWTAEPEQVQARADYDRMMETRLEAQRCVQLLRTMEEPFDVREELGRLDWQDAEAEARGY